MKIDLYTAQECEWLDKVLALFNINAIKVNSDVGIKHTEYIFSCDTETATMIKLLMKYNYEKNFR